MTSTLQTMGVINITPDSFSDGGHYNCFESCRKHISVLISQGIQYLDIGAESTAPFNDSINREEEQRRYRDIFFPVLSSFSKLPTLSIDTYRPETFLWVFKCLREKGFTGDIIWNDVSGVLDEKTFEIIDHLKIGYIYTYNRIVSRKDIGNHLKFIGKEDVFEEAVKYFQRGIKSLSSLIPVQKIWLDPGFGFSKAIEQNWDMVERLPSLFHKFGDYTFLLGVSRKRFLQSMIESDNDEEKRKKSEFLHLLLCTEWMQTLPWERFVVRLHDPEISLLARNYVTKRKSLRHQSSSHQW